MQPIFRRTVLVARGLAMMSAAVRAENYPARAAASRQRDQVCSDAKAIGTNKRCPGVAVRYLARVFVPVTRPSSLCHRCRVISRCNS